jgi:hypothetical protein
MSPRPSSRTLSSTEIFRVSPIVEQNIEDQGGNMIIGAHSIIYSKDPDADRAFLRDVIGFSNVDVGGGWLIFGLPPSEVAFHPSERNNVHEFYLMCDDVEAFITEMSAKQVTCTKVHEEPWGRLTDITLPGGGKLGVYQPLHQRPPRAG